MTTRQQIPGTGNHPRREEPITGCPPQNAGYSTQTPTYQPQNAAYPPQNPGNPPPYFGYPPNHEYPPPPKYGDNPGHPPAYPGENPPGIFVANAFVPEINTSNQQVPQNSKTLIDSPPQQAAVQARNDPEGSMQDLRTFYFSETSIKHGFIRIAYRMALVSLFAFLRYVVFDIWRYIRQRRNRPGHPTQIRLSVQSWDGKVYAILMLQLLITVGLIALLLYHATIYWSNHRKFVYIFVIVSAFITNFVLLLLMVVHPTLRRQSPTNYVFLILFTVSKGILLASLSAACKTDAIWMAAGITAVVCFAVIIFSFQTKWEFNLLSAPIFVAASILLVFGIVGFVNVVDIGDLCCATFGALIFSLILIFNTHLMISGRHKYTISPEEYTFTALSLYIDIVFFFTHIRRIIVALKNYTYSTRPQEDRRTFPPSQRSNTLESQTLSMGI